MEEKYVLDVTLKDLIKELENILGEKVYYKVELDDAILCNRRKMTKSQILAFSKEHYLQLTISLNLFNKNKDFNQTFILKGYSFYNKSFVDGRSISDSCYVSYEKDVDFLGYHYSELKLKNDNLENIICHFRMDNLIIPEKKKSKSEVIALKAILNCLEKYNNNDIVRVR